MAETYHLRVTITQQLAERLAKFAEADKRSQSSAVELLLSEALDTREPKKARANAS